MSKLVDEYFELGKKVFAAVDKGENVSDIQEKMAKVKEKFDEKDWNELIARVPTHIKPMVKAQKEKVLK